jgi:hypothetical protein
MMPSKFIALFLFLDTFVTVGVWEGTTGGVSGFIASTYTACDEKTINKRSSTINL